MPAMQNNGGDRLARGAASHTFRPMGERVTRDNWDKMFENEAEPVVKATYILNCPVHGEHSTTRECFVSGGYPQLDQNLAVKCNIEGCTEKAVYAGYTITATEQPSGNSGSETGVSGAVSGKAKRKRRK
jgi:hypothetical protein